MLRVLCAVPSWPRVSVHAVHAVQGIMPAALAVLRYGGVAAAVHALMQDSLDAALADSAVQAALMQLIGHVCTRPDALPLLSSPTCWPARLAPAAAQHTDPTGGAPPLDACERCLSVRHMAVCGRGSVRTQLDRV